MSQPRAHILVGNIQHVRGLNLQDLNFALPVKTCANIMGCEIVSRKVCCAGIACSAAVLSHILRGRRATLPRGHPRIPDLSRLDSGTFPFGLAPDSGCPGPFAPNIHVFSGAGPRHSGPFPFRFRTFPGWSLPCGRCLVSTTTSPLCLLAFTILHSSREQFFLEVQEVRSGWPGAAPSRQSRRRIMCLWLALLAS